MNAYLPLNLFMMFPWKCLGINHSFPRNLWPLSAFISLEFSLIAGGTHRGRGREREKKGRKEEKRELIALVGGISYHTHNYSMFALWCIGR